MLTTLNLKVGSILHDMEQNIDHRVIYMNKDYFVTILINGIKEKTEINEWHIQTLQHFVNKKQIAVREPKFDKVFDFDSLPEKSKETYLRNKDIVETVDDIYGPCYFCLGTRKPKPCFQELADKYNISKKTVFYVIKQYLTIGRPIVHAMVDVYSRMITAVSVSLENNSVLGFTNCLLNLGEDNKQLCRRYGLELKDGLWDINVLPNRLRSDRGSEYRSKEVKRICNELNITLELVPPAMGSLKGQVEQLFHQYHSVQNDLLEGRGLITKRHDSNHHRHAVLTLDDIWVFVINQTIAHNMMTMSQYPMTKDMLEKSVHPIPLELWDYGCTKYGAPRPIVNLDQFEYSIRKEVRARITRKGIEWNGLYYIANDPWLAEQITKTRRSSVPLKCRLDERNIGSLWYIADNRLVKATLNENRAGNYEFNGMSLRNYEEYKTKKKELVMEKAQKDQEIRCARRMGMQATLDDAVRVANQTAPNDDKTKNIRHNRKEESIIVLEANSIGARLNTDDAPSLIPLKNAEPEPETLSEPESNEETGSMTFEEALQKIKQKM